MSDVYLFGNNKGDGECLEDAPCPDCDGSGEVVLCIDDLCYRQEQCIHGDPPDPCPECKGTGRVEADNEGDAL